MAYLRLALTAAVLFFCACAVQQSEAIKWREIPAVQSFLKSNPRARRMTQSPLDGLIDLLIQILVKLLQIILTDPIRAQLDNLSEKVSLLEGIGRQ